MPGKSQLQKFNKDLLSLGDEVTLRAGRGEKPVTVPIPKDIKDINDSEDFVLGMPENEAAPEVSSVDEDLSDLTSLVNPSSSSKTDDAPAPSFEAPDMSSILNPIMDPSAADDMPDLSMFDEPVEEEQPEPEPEPEPVEVSVADMGLEALLAGAGFDNTEGMAAPEPEPEEIEDAEPEPLDDLDVPVEEISEDDAFAQAVADIPGFDMGDLGAPAAPAADDFSAPSMEDFGASADDFEIPAEGDNSFDAVPEMDNFDLPDMGGLDIPSDDLVAPTEDFGDVPAMDDFSAPTMEDFGAAPSDFDLPVDDLAAPADGGDFAPADDFALPTDDFEMPADGGDLADTPAGDDFALPADDLAAPTDDFAADLPAMDDFSAPSMEDFGAAPSDFDLPADDLAAPADGGDLADTFDLSADGGDIADLSDGGDAASTDDFGDLPPLDDMGDLPDFGSDVAEPVDIADAVEDIPDFEEESGEFEDTSLDEPLDDVGEGPVEQFDTTEMDGMDFELGKDDEFAMEGEFEIPGFSDVSTPVEPVKPSKGGLDLDTPDFTDAMPSDSLPPNTLSDEQYQQFLKNLHTYPLNVRLAFEDLIVQDEFTDDAEFEVIEKILNRAPARSVANMLEKMLDVSLPVPRDYENRTAEEYEAYKKSLSYQLKNKIIPGMLIGVVCLLVCWGIFNFTKNCIYKPLKAVKLYKQGYTLLQADEYPQSEMKFNEAVHYRLNKKWFFNYARGYREHKQFQRADKMYQNILNCFNHDKAAGLEYADMLLNDLANYERAEEIVRREVLDYHINDQDGILKLGDIFLEWGTEKDPSKLELAREQYATLIQMYGANNLYNSRMMRYFIRSDNLRQVLQIKGNFEGKGKEKSLSAEDWTELSGYLLAKAYGPLSPSEEYLRYKIEGLRKLLITAVNADKTNPIALYNLADYFIRTNENTLIESTLKNCIEMFNQAKSMKRRDIYKYIDAYRLLGEYYVDSTDYLQAQEQYAEGITLYTTERDNAGFTGNKDIGKLYQDLADLNYFVSGDYENALLNYKASVELENDNPQIRYKIGYIQYSNKNYVEALGSFMKAGDGNIKERNLMLAMANTLSLRGDDYAAEGYYEQLIHSLDDVVLEHGIVTPQKNRTDYDIVNTYLCAANNYGVTLYRLAKRTGDSSKNGQAMVQFSQSLRAWDALTRNQDTLVRLGGSNLAEQNMQYITHPIPEYEPAIYTEIQKTLTDKEKL